MKYGQRPEKKFRELEKNITAVFFLQLPKFFLRPSAVIFFSLQNFSPDPQIFSPALGRQNTYNNLFHFIKVIP